MARTLLTGSAPRAWLTVALLLALLIGSFAFVSRLTINNAPEVYFPPGAPAVVFDRQLRKHFPEDQVLIVLFEGAHIMSPKFFRALDQVVHRLRANPIVERVFSPTSLDHIASSEDGFVVEPLINVKKLQAGSSKAIIDRLESDRFAPGMVVSKDASVVALVVRPRRLTDSWQSVALQKNVLSAIHAAGLSGNVAGVAGQVALDVAELQSLLHDTAVFVPLTSLVGLFLIWWLFRRAITIVMAVVVMATVVGGTLAVIAIWGRPYTLIAGVIPPFMTALTIALLIHLYNAVAHAAHAGATGVERIERALQDVRRPTRYTVLTTIAGLLSLGLSPIQPIQTFGVAAAVGMVLMYFVVIVLLPHLFAYWDRKAWPMARGSLGMIDWLVRHVARVSIRRAGWIVGVTIVLFAAGSPWLFQVRAETDLYRFFHPQHPLIQSTKLVEQKLTGVSTLELILDAPARDGLKEPRRLQAIRNFQHWLGSLPEVDRSMSMAEVIEEMNWAFHGENPDYRRVPADRRLVSQYLFVYDGRDLYDLVDREFRRARIPVNLRVDGANEIKAVMDTIRTHLKAHPIADLQVHIAGLGRLFADQQELLITGQVRSLWSAMGLIFLILAVLWRSPKAAALCMVPNIAPVVLIFILMGMVGIWLDVATAMIAGIAVGIAVDDTIHIYHSFSKHRSQGAGTVLALMRTYRHAGRAVVATTFILCAQFLLLMSSAFVPTDEFGLLTSVGLFSALIFDVMLLPAMLVLLRPKDAVEPAARAN